MFTGLQLGASEQSNRERVSLATWISDSDVTRSCWLTCDAPVLTFGSGALLGGALPSVLYLRHPRLPQNQYVKVCPCG